MTSSSAHRTPAFLTISMLSLLPLMVLLFAPVVTAASSDSSRERSNITTTASHAPDEDAAALRAARAGSEALQRIW